MRIEVFQFRKKCYDNLISNKVTRKTSNTKEMIVEIFANLLSYSKIYKNSINEKVYRITARIT